MCRFSANFNCWHFQFQIYSFLKHTDTKLCHYGSRLLALPFAAFCLTSTAVMPMFWFVFGFHLGLWNMNGRKYLNSISFQKVLPTYRKNAIRNILWQVLLLIARTECKQSIGNCFELCVLCVSVSLNGMNVLYADWRSPFIEVTMSMIFVVVVAIFFSRYVIASKCAHTVALPIRRNSKRNYHRFGVCVCLFTVIVKEGILHNTLKNHFQATHFFACDSLSHLGYFPLCISKMRLLLGFY